MGGGFSRNFLPFPNGPWCDPRAPRFRARGRAGRLAVEIMTWYCPPGTMSKPGRAVTL